MRQCSALWDTGHHVDSGAFGNVMLSVWEGTVIKVLFYFDLQDSIPWKDWF